MFAYCYSLKCQEVVSINCKPIRKDVKKTAIECPDCGSVLVWSKKDKRPHYNVAGRTISEKINDRNNMTYKS